MREHYVDQVRLLLEVLPHIASESAFALKGGTAINLFHRDMPRLSVDIDLTWLRDGDYEPALREIDSTLDRIVATITKGNPRLAACRIKVGGNNETRFMVTRDGVGVKIETSPVARKAVHPASRMVASGRTQKEFGFAEANVLSFEDLYGGKLVAALDRQTPRDLFDVKTLYENEGLTDDLIHVFMVYVAGSRRPMHEILSSRPPFRNDRYDAQFAGMTRIPITWEALAGTGRRLHDDIRSRLTGRFAHFLLSLHDAEPDFGLIGLSEAAKLPAVRWKLVNLEKFKKDDPMKHARQRRALERLLH